MRILYASTRPPYPFFLGGAARCAHTLLQTLAIDHSIECAAVGSETYSVTPWTYPKPAEYATLGINNDHQGVLDCGYPVHILANFTQTLSKFIDDFKPDIIWSQLEGAIEVLKLAKNKGIQGLYYVHDAEFDTQELREIANLGCHFVCSSQFLADKTQRAIGRQAHVVYPAANLYFGTPSKPDGFITMINPHQVKGLNTLLKIAKHLPKQRFLLVESWKLNNQALTDLHKQLAILPNVQFMHRVADIRIVYQQTKLLLIPSIWEEGFGMVSFEAQSCRIPVIASQRGGLPESVGDGGILIKDYQDVEKWLIAIDSILNSPLAYSTLADKSYQHASSIQFTPKKLANDFLNICSNNPPPMDMVHRYFYVIKRNLKNFTGLYALLKKHKLSF